MAAHGHLLKVEAVAHGQVHVAFLVHDVNGAEVPAVDLQGFAVACRGIPVTLVECVGLHNSAVGNLGLESPDHVPGQNVGSVLFTGVQLYADFAENGIADFPIEPDEMFSVNVLREVDGGVGSLCGT